METGCSLRSCMISSISGFMNKVLDWPTTIPHRSLLLNCFYCNSVIHTSNVNYRRHGIISFASSTITILRCCNDKYAEKKYSTINLYCVLDHSLMNGKSIWAPTCRLLHYKVLNWDKHTLVCEPNALLRPSVAMMWLLSMRASSGCAPHTTFCCICISARWYAEISLLLSVVCTKR